MVATARSNKVATTLAVQDYSQLKMHYGKEQAEVIMNIVENVIIGQVSGDTSKQLPEKFGNYAGQGKCFNQQPRYLNKSLKTTRNSDTTIEDIIAFLR